MLGGASCSCLLREPSPFPTPSPPPPRPSCVPMDALCSRPASVSMQVNIHVPAPELQSDIIAITGLAANLDRAKAGLLERVKSCRLSRRTG